MDTVLVYRWTHANAKLNGGNEVANMAFINIWKIENNINIHPLNKKVSNDLPFVIILKCVVNESNRCTGLDFYTGQ